MSGFQLGGLAERLRETCELAVLRKPLSFVFRGNDGLTGPERQAFVDRFNATVGHRPPATPEHLERLHALASKGAPHVRHRPHVPTA